MRYSDGPNQIFIQIRSTRCVFGKTVLFKSIEQSSDLRRSGEEEAILAQIYRADLASPWILYLLNCNVQSTIGLT